MTQLFNWAGEVRRKRARSRRRKAILFWIAQGIGLILLALALAYVSAGCTPNGPASGFTDEQWLQFCPDGHCPIYKVGVAINAAGDEGMPE
ncbi:MAG: hypothetical protein NTW96_27640 [Planctomycetia bacterium]|nr:hypothetical protein [Planctomycetia bacterium]